MIFEVYTGNAMLNNALMTVEALGGLRSVEEITPKILENLFVQYDLPSINKRLKNYTMIFSLNNPLVNPAKKIDNAGEKTYINLLKSILNNFESEGNNICEISGLRFSKTFEAFYREEIENQKRFIQDKKLEPKEEKKQLTNLENTDFSLNRSWFPLIGGLGSDAQALPQAKYTIQIHPICIVVMQFLPLASLLYKGGILLIDSSNFEFTKEFIVRNVKDLRSRIDVLSNNEIVENVRDYSKGNYILKAIQILGDKEIVDEYSDLNLWSFSNSGTGASCEIDRIPNALIKKLQIMMNVSSVASELNKILSSHESSFSFLNSIENNTDWWLLYPNVFGSGKKRTEYPGVSITFFEAYHNAIGSSLKIKYAKYIAYLIDKYKTKYFEKYLENTSAWNEDSYKVDLYSVLVEAAKNADWSLLHHIQILDEPDRIPIRNNFYSLHKSIHFYYQKRKWSSLIPDQTNQVHEVKRVCNWMVNLLKVDKRRENIINDLTNPQQYKNVSYSEVFCRQAAITELNLFSIVYTMYDEKFNLYKFGLNELLRIYYLQAINEDLSDQHFTPKYNPLLEKWFDELTLFAIDYESYYLAKYENRNGQRPYGKLLNQLLDIPKDNRGFLLWFSEAVENTNSFLKENTLVNSDKWSDALLYDPYGEFAIYFASFAIRFTMLKQYHFFVSNSTSIIVSK